MRYTWGETGSLSLLGGAVDARHLRWPPCLKTHAPYCNRSSSGGTADDDDDNEGEWWSRVNPLCGGNPACCIFSAAWFNTVRRTVREMTVRAEMRMMAFMAGVGWWWWGGCNYRALR